MRIVVGLIAMMSVGALSQALANGSDPQSAGAPQGGTQDSSPAQTAPSPPDLQAGAKAPVVDRTAATARAVPASAATTQQAAAKPELTHDERNLIRQGYKLEVRNGENWFCKREPVLGSRLQQNKECGTEQMWSKRRVEEQESLRTSLKSAPLPTNMGPVK
jgi:hypothetical protein